MWRHNGQTVELSASQCPLFCSRCPYFQKHVHSLKEFSFLWEILHCVNLLQTTVRYVVYSDVLICPSVCYIPHWIPAKTADISLKIDSQIITCSCQFSMKDQKVCRCCTVLSPSWRSSCSPTILGHDPTQQDEKWSRKESGQFEALWGCCMWGDWP